MIQEERIQIVIDTKPGHTRGCNIPKPRTTTDLIDPVGKVPGRQ